MLCRGDVKREPGLRIYLFILEAQLPFKRPHSNSSQSNNYDIYSIYYDVIIRLRKKKSVKIIIK